MYSWTQQRRHIFQDRHEAGKRLALKLRRYADEQSVVLSLPRGGVVVGFEVARALHAPHDVLVSRKVGLPGNPEFGIGAVSELGGEVFDEEVIDLFQPDEEELSRLVSEERAELRRRVKMYRSGHRLPLFEGTSVLLVDDGLATGVTAKAAIETLRMLRAQQVIFAAPVCAQETVSELRGTVSEVVCLQTPSHLRAIGHWYQSFDEVSDEEVGELLRKTDTRTTPDS